jgi:hypothetical protein
MEADAQNRLAKRALRKNEVACLAVAILADREPDSYDLKQTPLYGVVGALRAAIADTSYCGAVCVEAARWLCECKVEAYIALAQSGTLQWLTLQADDSGAPKGTCPPYVRYTRTSKGPTQPAYINAVKALRFLHRDSDTPTTVLLKSTWPSPVSVADAANMYHRTSSAHVPAVAIVPVPVASVQVAPVLEATPQSRRYCADHAAEEEISVVYAVARRVDGASAGPRSSAGARAGTGSGGGGAGVRGGAADVHMQLHGLQTARALEAWTRPVVRTRVMAVLLRQLFLEGAFAHGTPLWHLQLFYMDVNKRVASFTGVTRQFCRGLHAAAPATITCGVERAVRALASKLRQLSTTSPNLDGCADRADRERRVHACALAGTLLNVLRDLPVSGRLGMEPTIVDMIMFHAVLRSRTERDRHNVARPCLQFARLTAGQGPVPMALPTFFYETLDPVKHGWQHDKSGPWCTLAYQQARPLPLASCLLPCLCPCPLPLAPCLCPCLCLCRAPCVPSWQVLKDGWWRMRPVFVQGNADDSHMVTVGAISPRTNSSMVSPQRARAVHVHTLVRSALTEPSVRAAEAVDCATDAILQWYYTEMGQLVSMRYMCKHLSVPGTRCWARVTTVKEGDSPMVGTLPDVRPRCLLRMLLLWPLA